MIIVIMENIKLHERIVFSVNGKVKIWNFIKRHFHLNVNSTPAVMNGQIVY